MEQLKKHRSVLRTLFTKKGNEVESLIQEEPRDLTKVTVNMKMLETKLEELMVVDGKIYETLLADQNVTEQQLTEEIEGCDCYKQRLLELQDKLKCEEAEGSIEAASVRSSIEAVSTRSSTAPVELATKRKFELPKIEFKKFGGDIREWLPFWAQFKKVHEDDSIDLTDKIVYLSQATIPGSRAQQIVDSYPAVPENYEKIINSLKSRYGREDLQIEVYVRELLKLVLNKSGKNCNISLLYDKIESQLRFLETLGITCDKYAAMLYPLIESCLPEHLIRTFQRSNYSNVIFHSSELLDNEVHDSLEKRLRGLMQFLRGEVENEQRISLAAEGFGLDDVLKKTSKYRQEKVLASVPTASGLINCNLTKCIFCGGDHDCKDCFKAQKMNIEQKREELAKEKACFRCLKRGHSSRKCHTKLRCLICSRGHVAIMCPELPANKTENSISKDEPISQTLYNNNSFQVCLQTLRVKLVGHKSEKQIRILIDTGSQRSYIMKETARRMGFNPIRVEKIVHALFGGKNTEQQIHNCYEIKLLSGSYTCSLEVLDQPLICSAIPNIPNGPWLEELKTMNISISDVGDAGPIEVLLGADIVGKLYTGKMHNLQCGLVAVETLLGWTLMGKVPMGTHNSSVAMPVFSLFVQNATINQLWELDVLGISDPTEKKSREEQEKEAIDSFNSTIRQDEHGRYTVRLPWLENHSELADNLVIAKRRLESTVRKLKSTQLFGEYDLVFQDWLNEGIIEEVRETNQSVKVHYLPHRPVIKESSQTTKIRPVFDASSHEKGNPSLNQCLEVGPNLIELIPSILLRFRQCRIGVVSDIRKAFLQIAVDEKDRDFLRFLWLDQDGNTKIFRHRRVVFGVSSSPFLLAATIRFHLSRCRERSTKNNYPSHIVEKLAGSFYVDNCVTSVSNEGALQEFIRDASQIMDEAKMDLRGWEYSREEKDFENIVPVLGLMWHIRDDTLTINQETLSAVFWDGQITKRSILSAAQKLFDPIGFSCPVSLQPKLILQQLWERKFGWDDPLPNDIIQNFTAWAKEIHSLSEIKIPRWTLLDKGEADDLELHTFCDASSKAYSAAVFLRVVRRNEVLVFLLAAKSRVTPLKKTSMPRLELLGATIAARLYNSLKRDLPDMLTYFWSDSTTVISWIRGSEEWTTFVKNRVKEIRALTDSNRWFHVPGSSNPADLPSRGCSAHILLQSRWWEGPSWLYKDVSNWPTEAFEVDEEQVNMERKKTTVNLLNSSVDLWRLHYFSSYTKTVRMMAWVKRFCFNLKNPTQQRKHCLTVEEIHESENFIFKVIQKEAFAVDDVQIKSLRPFTDERGLIRLRSQVSQRIDTRDFRFPILLPGKNSVVRRLIFEVHKNSCHIGTQGLLNILREKYWILGGRRIIRAVLSKCVFCKRHLSKPFSVEPPPLPLNRVRDAVAFEITGIDLAGPLYLRDGQKSWICLFTCAVFRAVHLELVTSLSTPAFLLALRRFTARRGRPRCIYSDNGTNFVGFENACKSLDWSAIEEFSSVQRIEWRFNPPTGAWWGGWWERLIGIVKGLLRKTLGRACLVYEELQTLLCECENVINSRPLTYVSGDSEDLVPLTPAMFLREQVDSSLPECDIVERTSLCRKVKYRQQLMRDLRVRFRNEYLAHLKASSFYRSGNESPSVGEIVLVGNDKDKRLHWPLGRIVELIPGKDNKVRLARVKTSRGELLRPLQRLYPLELNSASQDAEDQLSEFAFRELSQTPRPPPRDHLQSSTKSDCAGVKNGHLSENVGDCAGVENGHLSGNVGDSAEKIKISEKRSRTGRLINLPSRFK